MNGTSGDETGRPPPPNREGGEDIEILEVVVLDEDGAPVAVADPDDVEVVFEPAEPVEAEPVVEAPPPSEDASLRERLLRLHADFENFKKRIDRERVEHLRHATYGLVGRLLPVLDNFERAMESVRPGVASDALLEGFSLIQKQLANELEAEGLRPMESVGETFDPTRHEAVATDSEAPFPPHTVTAVFQRGYFLHERVLRPALVRVRVESSNGNVPEDDGKES